MQFSVIQSEVRSRLVEPTARYFTDAEVKRWINIGYRDFVSRTRWTQRVKAFGVTANQYEYTLPSDYVAVEELVWQDKYKVYLADLDEIRDIIGASPTLTGTRPKAFIVYPSDKRFRIFPAPSAASSATAINLGGGISSSATTITVDSTTGFPSMGRIIIESEQVIYYGTTATTFTQCVRGADDTTAATHADDIAVTEAELLLAHTYVPVDMSADADVPKIPEIWHEALVLYAMHIGLQKRSLWRESAQMLQEYERITEKAVAERARAQMDRQWFIKDEDYYTGIYHYGVL